MDLIETPDHETITWNDAVRKLADHLLLQDSHLVTLLLNPAAAHSLTHLPAGWAFFLVGAQTSRDYDLAVFHAPHAGPRLAEYAAKETGKITLARMIGLPVAYPIAILAVPDALDVSEWADMVGLPAAFFTGEPRVCATASVDAPDVALVPQIVTDAMKIAFPDAVDEIDDLVTDLEPEDIARLRGEQQ